MLGSRPRSDLEHPSDSNVAAVALANQAELNIRRGIRSAIVGIAVNLSLGITKCVVGVLGHSFALVSDGVESFSDVVSSSVVALGLFVSLKPPDHNHPYGHGKAEPIAAIVVSLALVCAGIFIAIQSISQMRTPHPLPESFTLFVLVAVIAIKSVLSRYVGSIGERIESSAVRADAWHHLSDALTSGFAFVGICIALISKRAWADDLAALCASPVILFNGLRQLQAPFAELLDTSPSPGIEVSVRTTAALVQGVAGLDKCSVRKIGFRYYVDLHVLVDGRESVTTGHRIAHAVEEAIIAAEPKISEVLVHIEPTDETRF
jgi:cation diffusion facilitator family transporter